MDQPTKLNTKYVDEITQQTHNNLVTSETEKKTKENNRKRNAKNRKKNKFTPSQEEPMKKREKYDLCPNPNPTF